MPINASCNRQRTKASRQTVTVCEELLSAWARDRPMVVALLTFVSSAFPSCPLPSTYRCDFVSLRSWSKVSKMLNNPFQYLQLLALAIFLCWLSQPTVAEHTASVSTASKGRIDVFPLPDSTTRQTPSSTAKPEPADSDEIGEEIWVTCEPNYPSETANY